MLLLTVFVLTIAVVAGLFGFGLIAGMAFLIAKMIFFGCLGLSLILLLLDWSDRESASEFQ